MCCKICSNENFLPLNNDTVSHSLTIRHLIQRAAGSVHDDLSRYRNANYNNTTYFVFVRQYEVTPCSLLL